MSRLRLLPLACALVAVAIAPAIAPADGATEVAGVPADLVGVHGPTVNYAENLEVVSHLPFALPSGSSALSLGNHGGLAFVGSCAYVGRWHDYNSGIRKNGVQIVDVSNPAAPARVGDIAATISSGGVTREIRAVDLPNFKMLTVMMFSNSQTNRTNNRMQYYTFPSGDCTKPELAGTFDFTLIRPHEFYQWVDPDPPAPFTGPRVLNYVTAPLTPPTVYVIDASNPAAPRLAGTFDAGQPVVSEREESNTGLGKYAHSISVSADGTEATISDWDGGFLTVDTTDFALGLPGGVIRPKGAMSVPYIYPAGQLGNTHSAVRIPGTNDFVVGDEIYITTDGCPFGWMRVVDAGDLTTPPSQIGEFMLEENRRCVDQTVGAETHPFADARNSLGLIVDGTFSMHNQTLVERFALVSWYGGGLRVVNLTDPANPVEAGMFVPKPVGRTSSLPDTSAPIWRRTPGTDDDWEVAMWSYPIVRDGLIYVVDMNNGLYVLRPSTGAPFAAAVAATAFAEGNSNQGDLSG